MPDKLAREDFATPGDWENALDIFQHYKYLGDITDAEGNQVMVFMIPGRLRDITGQYMSGRYSRNYIATLTKDENDKYSWQETSAEKLGIPYNQYANAVTYEAIVSNAEKSGIFLESDLADNPALNSMVQNWKTELATKPFPSIDASVKYQQLQQIKQTIPSITALIAMGVDPTLLESGTYRAEIDQWLIEMARVQAEGLPIENLEGLQRYGFDLLSRHPGVNGANPAKQWQQMIPQTAYTERTYTTEEGKTISELVSPSYDTSQSQVPMGLPGGSSQAPSDENYQSPESSAYEAKMMAEEALARSPETIKRKKETEEWKRLVEMTSRPQRVTRI